MANVFLKDYFKNKKKSYLRILFFLVIFLSLVLLSKFLTKTDSNFIAKITINGVIIDNEEIFEDLSKLENDKNLSGLLIIVNSPGGTVVSSKQLYRKLKRISKSIPTAVSMKEVAASGGYMVSLAGKKIFCYEGTLTGSIGVILQSANIQELMQNIGIKPIIFKSGELKAVPNPLETIELNGEENIKKVIKDLHDSFLSLVKNERKISEENLKLISDGRIFTGTAAKKINLVDEIGDESDAIKWLNNEIKSEKELEIIDINEKKMINSFFNFSIFKNLFNEVSFYPNGLYAIWSLNNE